MYEDYFIQTAMHLAKRCHDGQYRKYTGEPYLVHPFAVAGLVQSVTNDEDMICAALLHDTVEDSDMKISTIRGLFSMRIGDIVWELTDNVELSTGNRAYRKRLALERLQFASPETQTIKLADLIDNTKSILAHDPAFAKVYMREKDDLLHVLTKGDPMLWALAREIVDKYYEQEEA